MKSIYTSLLVFSAVTLGSAAAGQTFAGFNNTLNGDTVNGQNVTLVADNDILLNTLQLVPGDTTPNTYTLGGNFTARVDVQDPIRTVVAILETPADNLVNQGVFTVEAPVNTDTRFEFDLATQNLDNRGTFVIQDQVIFTNNFANITNAGDFTLGNQTDIRVDRFTHSSGNLTVRGTLDADNFDFNGGTIDTPLNVRGATLNLGTSNTLDAAFIGFNNTLNGDTVNDQNVTLVADNDILLNTLQLVPGDTTPNTYTLGGNFTARVDVQDPIRTVVAILETPADNLVNQGVFTVEAPVNTDTRFEFDLATQNLDNRGTFVIQDQVIFTNNFDNITNAGDFTLGNQTDIRVDNVDHQNGNLTVRGSLTADQFTASADAVLTLDGGTLAISGNTASNVLLLDSSSQLIGNGTIDGSVVVGGEIAPGFSPGAIQINGDLSFLDGGRATLEAGASGAASLVVMGELNLDNLLLAFDIEPGSIFDEGDVLSTIQFGSVFGDLQDIEVAGLDRNAVRIDIDPNTSEIVVTAIQTIPEPTTALIVFAGGLWICRRKQTLAQA